MARLAQARKARLSIPRVQRPRHPGVSRGRRAYTPRSGLAQRVVAKPSLALATTQAQPSGAAVPATQSTPTAPLSEAPKAVSAPSPPSGLFDLPAYSGNGEDPRDAAYWSHVSKLKFSAEQDYAKTQLEQQRSDTDYNDALQTAIRNRATEQRTLGENAIRGNLSASGWLDRNEAEDTLGYTQERAHAQLNKTEEDAAREATRKAILQGYTLDAAAELGEAAARLAQRKREEAERAEALAALRESGGEEDGSAAAWSGEAPTGEAGGPFWGSKAPGGYMPKPKPKHKGSGSGGTPYSPPNKNPNREALDRKRKKAR